MKTIPLTKGYKAIVDNEDYEYLMQWKWQADNSKPPHIYAVANVYTNGKRSKIRMHRHIMNASKGDYVDHINHNTLDNRRENLRVCSNAENARNSRKTSKVTSSKYKGVYFNKTKQKWQAQIVKDYKNYFLGRFETEEKAAIAYNIAAELMFGNFAAVNKIEEDK